MFDIRHPLKIINVTRRPDNEWHCDAFLVYNDTFVNIKSSRIKCSKVKGSNPGFGTSRSVEAETGFQFRLGFNANAVKGGGIETKINSAVVSKLCVVVLKTIALNFIGSTPVGGNISSTEKIVNFTKIDELTDVTEEQKENIKETLVKDLLMFNNHERAAASQRFKKRWVQSTQISDTIGRNTRLKDVITASVNHTRNTFKPSSESFARQASNSHTVDGFLEDIRVNCENGFDVFSGGLVGADVVCDANANEDKYRRIDGVCNNLAQKHFGATGIAMRRLANAAYDDGLTN